MFPLLGIVLSVMIFPTALKVLIRLFGFLFKTMLLALVLFALVSAASSDPAVFDKLLARAAHIIGDGTVATLKAQVRERMDRYVADTAASLRVANKRR